MKFSSHSGYILYPAGIDNGVVCGSTFDASAGGIYSNYALHTSEGPGETRNITEARDRLRDELGFGALVTLKQVHGEKIHKIGGDIRGYTDDPLIEGDAIITDSKNVLIGVLTADCVPVMFYSAERVGIAHCGWKGVFAGLHTKTALAMGSAPGDLTVVFGPNIRVCCYKVGADLVEKFRDAGRDPVFTERGGEFYFDLEGTIKAELISLGIPAGNIHTPELCTLDSSAPGFYSYRRGDLKPRILSFIGLR
ncbi:MAG: hypothetical protein A2Y33_04910 [Spirochaetes bacterium GWF1_51_8]|nr:MAG: hypothetical protein A2Y33_04910 [Spirochaetes bacterium GWF1_51_8]